MAGVEWIAVTYAPTFLRSPKRAARRREAQRFSISRSPCIPLSPFHRSAALGDLRAGGAEMGKVAQRRKRFREMVDNGGRGQPEPEEGGDAAWRRDAPRNVVGGSTCAGWGRPSDPRTSVAAPLTGTSA